MQGVEFRAEGLGFGSFGLRVCVRFLKLFKENPMLGVRAFRYSQYLGLQLASVE